jgi:dethiobiotin synthetase
MKSFFITGTDTGIGKTAITCAIANLMRSSGMDVGVMKPFATGIQQKNGFKSEDVTLLAKYARVSDPEELINPYFFPVPASPYTASKKLGKTIDIGLALSEFEKLQSVHDVVLVEGIGGIMTPILKDYVVADLIKDFNLDAIIVAGTKIGTINHTLLTLDSCKKYGVRTAGLIINGVDKDGYDAQDLKADLVSLSGVDVLCTVPNVQDGNIERVSQILKQDDFLNILSKL